ncbi:secretory-abundant heat soluble protein 64681-like [Paramacrobiotus metropolitanus]|uniref:secretory-abundant heat soluble protein 64681-like n=1 Tax=Paramacrobiotus metropolitanus TaxID=2943436 RepID=UPI0024459977|nr:secretory-abundant heat soluble protein 64681-like [Paramacrobiotus metropolitanus]
MNAAFIFALVIIAAVSAEDHPSPATIAKDNEHLWIGKWKSTGRQEHFEDFMKALGLPNHDVHDPATTHELWKEGDKFHHKIAAPEVNYKKHICFKLGEEGKSSYNGTEFTFKYTEQASTDLTMDVTMPGYNKTIVDIWHVDGDELVKTFKVAQVVAKRWYQRL